MVKYQHTYQTRSKKTLLTEKSPEPEPESESESESDDIISKIKNGKGLLIFDFGCEIIPISTDETNSFLVMPKVNPYQLMGGVKVLSENGVNFTTRNTKISNLMSGGSNCARTYEELLRRAQNDIKSRTGFELTKNDKEEIKKVIGGYDFSISRTEIIQRPKLTMEKTYPDSILNKLLPHYRTH